MGIAARLALSSSRRLAAAIALPHALVSLILAQNQLPHLQQLEISFALIGNA